jgi:hypothetical protein
MPEPSATPACLSDNAGDYRDEAMNRLRAPLAVAAAVALAVAGCAAPAPVPFRLIDDANKEFQGTLSSDGQRMEVWLGDRLYQGFYIVATSVATTEQWPSRFGRLPRDAVTVTSGNSARAHLASTDGQRLACEFVFESGRAIGECRSPQGKTYQLIANQPSGR